MNVKDFFINIGKAVWTGTKTIVSKIFDAKLENVSKAGLFIGSVVVTVAFLVKSLCDRRKTYQDDSNKSTVDCALELNYTDKRNSSKIDPILKDIRKTLGGNKKSKMKKRNMKFNRKRFQKSFSELNETLDRNAYNPVVLNELEKFEREMREMKEEGNPGFFASEQFGQSLCRTWDKA